MSSPTIDALIRCLRAAPADGPLRLEAVDASDWKEIAQRARGLSVAHLLYHRLQTLEVTPPVPPPVWQRLQRFYLESAGFGMRLRHHLSGVLAALGAAGVTPIVLKGAYLAEGVYRNPALRPMNDVDLLVRQADLSAAQRSLLDLGY